MSLPVSVVFVIFPKLMVECFACAQLDVLRLINAVFLIDLVADLGVNEQQDDEGEDGSLGAHEVMERESADREFAKRLGEQDGSE